ncbi:MAG: hypothetical protein ABJA02_03945 [Acidobacteriota bacterium]
MSDIGLNLSGLLALIVFAWSAIGLAILALISLAIAYLGRSGNRGVRKHWAFGSFVSAAVLVILNLLALGAFAFLIDSMDQATNEVFDKIAIYVWAPLQLIIWIATAFLFNRSRK